MSDFSNLIKARKGQHSFEGTTVSAQNGAKFKKTLIILAF